MGRRHNEGWLKVLLALTPSPWQAKLLFALGIVLVGLASYSEQCAQNGDFCWGLHPQGLHPQGLHPQGDGRASPLAQTSEEKTSLRGSRLSDLSVFVGEKIVDFSYATPLTAMMASVDETKDLTGVLESSKRNICVAPAAVAAVTGPYCMAAPLSERKESSKDPADGLLTERDPSVLPIKPSPLRFNPTVGDHLGDASMESLLVLVKHDRVRNPEPRFFFIEEVAKGLCDYNGISRGWGVHYGLFEKGGGCLGELVKGGLTNHPKWRCGNYTEGLTWPYDDEFEENYELLVLSVFDMIPFEADQELGLLLRDDFLQKVIADPNVPAGQRQLYAHLLTPDEHVDGKEWHRGGSKRQLVQQLIEVGIQRWFGLPSPGEAFMWDESKQDTLETASRDTFQAIADLIGSLLPASMRNGEVYIFAICTWKTGARAEALSSAITSTEYVVGGTDPSVRWTNVVDEPLHKNAKTREEIFAYDFSTAQLDVADETFCCLIETHCLIALRAGAGVIFVDAQNYMYGDLAEPQRVLRRNGLVHIGTVLGGEVLVYQLFVGGKPHPIFVLLHGHFAIAGDSRPEITSEVSQLRAVTIDALRHVRRYATGEVSGVGDDFYHNATFGAMAAEVSTRGWHGSQRFAAAIYRDSVTPLTVSALDTYGGPENKGLTPKSSSRGRWELVPTAMEGRSRWEFVKDSIGFMHPASHAARRHWRNIRAGKYIQPHNFGCDQMLARFSWAVDEGHLSEMLDALNDEIRESPSSGRGSASSLWDQIIYNCAARVAKVEFLPLVEEWARNNSVAIKPAPRLTTIEVITNAFARMEAQFRERTNDFLWMVVSNKRTWKANLQQSGASCEHILETELQGSSTPGHQLSCYPVDMTSDYQHRASTLSFVIKSASAKEYKAHGQVKGYGTTKEFSTGNLRLYKFIGGKSCGTKRKANE